MCFVISVSHHMNNRNCNVRDREKKVGCNDKFSALLDQLPTRNYISRHAIDVGFR